MRAGIREGTHAPGLGENGPGADNCLMPVSASQLSAVAEQLGRTPRGVIDIPYTTPDGRPAVVTTIPVLEDGTPFPTVYYLTDPRLTAAASRLESAGVMRTMQERLADPDVAASYRAAHERYLSTRREVAQANGTPDLATDFSGGGMPDRVKCLHVLIAYSLAVGPGVNLFGDEAVAMVAAAGLRGIAVPADWPELSELSEPSDSAGA